MNLQAPPAYLASRCVLPGRPRSPVDYTVDNRSNLWTTESPIPTWASFGRLSLWRLGTAKRSPAAPAACGDVHLIPNPQHYYLLSGRDTSHDNDEAER